MDKSLTVMLNIISKYGNRSKSCIVLKNMFGRKIVLVVLFVFLGFAFAVGADDSEVKFTVQYYKSFSKSEEISMNRGFLKKAGDFVFGKSNWQLGKPMNVIARDTSEITVLDQASQIPTIIKPQAGVFEIMENDSLFPSLVGICLSGDEIFFTDSKLCKLFRISSNEIIEINTDISLSQPTGIAYDESTRQFWISETGMHRIAVLDCDFRFIKYIGGRGSSDSLFNFPTFLTFDKKGKCYVVDALNFRIQIFDSSGKFLSKFGSIGNATGYFANPKGIAIDSFGHIFVADGLMNIVQVFDASGVLLFYFGGKGVLPGEFITPLGIYIDENNFLYTADSGNSRIQIHRITKDK